MGGAGTPFLKEKLTHLGKGLINQEGSRTILFPTEDQGGFWVGGGNALQLGGFLYLIARFRDSGDSRAALAMGPRGRELAVFKAEVPKEDQGFLQNLRFEKVHSWGKEDVAPQGEVVLSIEGSCLVEIGGEIYVLVGSEKRRDYPEEVRDFQKEGTGVWSIDYFHAPSVEKLQPKGTIKSLLKSDDPPFLHFKDPVPIKLPSSSPTFHIFFCIHSFCWSSGTTGHAVLRKEQDGALVPLETQEDIFPRGAAWDVAVSRVTGQFLVPSLSHFSEFSQLALFFYDGAECFREHEESGAGKKRKRGHCCEELGGLAFSQGSKGEDSLLQLSRLSRNRPLFESPFGTGCSRYHSAVVIEGEGEEGEGEGEGDRKGKGKGQSKERGILAFWQQSQKSGAQALVAYFLSLGEVEKILQ